MSIKKLSAFAISLGAVSTINMNNLSEFPAELEGLGLGPQPGYLRPSPKEEPKSNKKSAEEIA